MSASWTGARLGSYTVQDLLGSGGMASVYRGFDTVLERSVAIKVISTQGQPPNFVARFKREARVLAQLRHPHIVQIYHFGEEQDCVYMVQELLGGATLAQRQRSMGRKKMPAAEVHQIVAQVASALDYAHSKGVIHRDVKPSNILYNDLGQLVLADFGIARTPTDSQHTATATGIVMGTPYYVAPEQAIGGVRLTAACDIYSLGVVLFELLTGKVPFDGDTPMNVVLKHLYDPPPRPSSLRADLPEQLDAVIARAINKEPDERYRRAGDLVSALQDAWPLQQAVGAGSDAAPAARPRSRASTKSVVASRSPLAPTSEPVAQNQPRKRAAKPKDAAPDVAVPTESPIRERANTRRPSARNAAPVVPAPPDATLPARSKWRLRMALLVFCIVAALIIFAPGLQILPTAWNGAQEVMRWIGLMTASR